MKQLISAVFVFFISIIYAGAQNINATLANYSNNYSQERVYLHYDKSTYAPGETVWYKIYMMQAIFPDDGSKTVYVDWTDDNGKLLLHSLSPVVDGTAFGQFQIPEDYTGHFIHVKSYTKWMLNFDSAFLYNKDLKVLSNVNKSSSSKNTIIPELTFFPEGGDAIEGVTNKIAFMANDQYGRPLQIKGVIKDNKGAVIDHLKIIHDGMGYFFIKPQQGETFTATWEDDKGVQHVTKLPSIKDSGVSLQVTISGTKRNFYVSTSPQSAGLKSLHIIGTMYQQPVFNITKELKDRLAEGIIPTESLPSGILTITVFDEQWKPLAERITYINNEEYYFYPEMTVQHWGLNKRAKDIIEISVPDSLSSNLSVSVTDLGIDYDTSDNIISHLLLTGELKGKVNNPAYYFINNSDSIMQQLDLVMLTHGWRRFDWEKVVKGEYPVIKYKRDTSYLSLSGKIYGATPSELRQAGSIILMVTQKKSGTQVYTTPLEDNGSFDDPDLILFDTARIYYQLAKAKGRSDISVQFMPGRLPPFSNNAKATGFYYNHLSDTTGNKYHLQLSEAQERELKFLKEKVLATVTVKANPKNTLAEMDKKYTSGLFSGGDAREFDLLNDPFALSSLDIFQYLQGKVAGLQINTTSNPPTLSWRGGTPQLYVDEVSTQPDMVQSIPVSDVAYLKVFPPPFMGGIGGGSGGAIAIYTRRGDDVKQEPGKGLSNNSVSGYTAIRQFYSPNYESFSEDNEKKDLRTTLYWNPSVTTSPGKSKVLLTFFNNDITNAFRVVIEGMTKDGRLAHVVQTME
ncbi:MAG TPA: hypothetical protein VFI29_08935 [Hanamia sp.]|nr:hypothetical protein [Hanamia sp.]